MVIFAENAGPTRSKGFPPTTPSLHAPPPPYAPPRVLRSRSQAILCNNSRPLRDRPSSFILSNLFPYEPDFCSADANRLRSAESAGQVVNS